MTLTAIQSENLWKLANYLKQKELKKKFSMKYFCMSEAEKTTVFRASEHECGTVGCALGHGPDAGIEPLYGEEWGDYCERAFGIKFWITTNEDDLSAYQWLFSSDWDAIDGTAYGAARRIYEFLQNGVPNNWRAQVCGREPYMFQDS